MDRIKTSEQIDAHRRRFLGTAAMTLAAAQLGMIGAAEAQSDAAKTARLPAITPGANTSFAALKQIDAGVLNFGYAEAGPADGPPVILLHGWPYDIHSFVDVAPLLAAAGYRGDRALSARLWHDALPLERDDAQRRAGGRGR
jgi:hypothetical protein